MDTVKVYICNYTNGLPCTSYTATPTHKLNIYIYLKRLIIRSIFVVLFLQSCHKVNLRLKRKAMLMEKPYGLMMFDKVTDMYCSKIIFMASISSIALPLHLKFSELSSVLPQGSLVFMTQLLLSYKCVCICGIWLSDSPLLFPRRNSADSGVTSLIRRRERE